jgi:hypothetical protein
MGSGAEGGCGGGGVRTKGSECPARQFPAKRSMEWTSHDPKREGSGGRLFYDRAPYETEEPILHYKVRVTDHNLTLYGDPGAFFGPGG